jgi:multimeric flavodoxin WrbA
VQSTILNACAEEDTFAAAALEALVGRLRRDSETLVIQPAGKKIANCTGCFGCWLRTPGVCVIDDDCRAITREIARADRIVFFTPVVFGGYHPDVKAVLERSIGILTPFFRVFRGEMHHPLRAREKAYELVAIGILDRTDEEAASAFRQRVWRNALNFNGLRWQAGTLVRAAGTAGIAASIDALLERMEAL